MKKILSILISVVIFAVSVLPAKAFFTEKSNLAMLQNVFEDAPLVNEITSDEENPTVDNEEDKLLAPEWSSAIKRNQEYSMEYVRIDSDGNESFWHAYCLGNRFALKGEMGFVEMNMVHSNGKTYAYFPSFPFFYIDTGLSMNYLSMYNLPTSTLLEVYEEDGFHVEKYSCADGEYSYYFLEEELYKMVCIGDNGESTCYSNFSYEVDLKDTIMPPTAIFNGTWLFYALFYYFS